MAHRPPRPSVAARAHGAARCRAHRARRRRRVAPPGVAANETIAPWARPADTLLAEELARYPLSTTNGTRAGVVHLVAELAPFARTGGLGEAVESLAEFQAASGIPTADHHAALPAGARRSRRTSSRWASRSRCRSVPQRAGAHLSRSRADRRRRRAAHGAAAVHFFIDNPHYFDRPALYGESGCDYPDNPRRYAFFSLAALVALPRIAPRAPSHPARARLAHRARAASTCARSSCATPYYERVRAVLSVHNAGFQGQFPAETMADVGLPWELYNHRQLEWYGRMNLLKGGLRSPTW